MAGWASVHCGPLWHWEGAQLRTATGHRVWALLASAQGSSCPNTPDAEAIILHAPAQKPSLDQPGADPLAAPESKPGGQGHNSPSAH